MPFDATATARYTDHRSTPMLAALAKHVAEKVNTVLYRFDIAITREKMSHQSRDLPEFFDAMI